MNKRNLSLIYEEIKKRSKEIQDLLPPLPSHPTRIAQAHLYTEIKYAFGRPIGEIRDSRFDDVMKLIDICCKHAREKDVSPYLQWVEPEPDDATLESFFA